MKTVAQGSRSALVGTRYRVRLSADRPELADVFALLLGADRKARGDEDLVFFGNATSPGVTLGDDGSVTVNLHQLPGEVDRVLVAASTEAQGVRFADMTGLTVQVDGDEQIDFVPGAVAEETALVLVSFYRHNGAWKLEASGQGYQAGLAALVSVHGIEVAADPAVAPVSPPPPAVNLEKVRVVITKDSKDKTAKLDLTKSRGEPGWLLTAGLEWDGRDAEYRQDGSVQRYGEGDLDIYFYCRNEHTNEYVVVSGEPGRQGSTEQWPFIRHHGDSPGPGAGGKAAVEQVEMRPNENGDILVNVYQSVDNGEGAIDTFGRPRAVIRYGRADAHGQLGDDADEIVIHVGNGEDSYWATVAHIDVEDGVLTVDGETRYSEPGSEDMPGLSRTGAWVRSPSGGPVGRSKSEEGSGLDRYSGTCR